MATLTSVKPIASRVAKTLRSMYGASRAFWLGLTTRPCTAAGYTYPASTASTSQIADEISGNRHDSVRNVDRYSAAVTTATTDSSNSAGNWAWTTE